MLTLLTIVLRNASLKNKEKLHRGLYRVLNAQNNKPKLRNHTTSATAAPANTTTLLRNLSTMPSGASKDFIFRQLFDRESCTYTYLLADGASRKAILIDPVYELIDRDVQVVKELDLHLIYAANTHVHADHVTGSGLLKQRLPECKSLISGITKAKADVYVNHGDKINVGDIEIEVRSTPGHTNGCVTYVCHREAMAFTGDALLVRGCGRTDFQQGDASRLYDSIYSEILSLPEDTRLYPAHDYKGFTVTTVREEKKYNPRLTRPKQDFIELMKNLNLAYPKQIDVAVPSNMVCGEQELVEEIRRKIAELKKPAAE